MIESTDGQPGIDPVRVLLVEDSVSNQRLMALHLQRAGHQADIAADGAAAVLAAGRVRYDLILMDISMPRLDGLEATRRIRAIAHCAGVPILALTGDGSETQRQACLEAGMNGFLTKPVRRDTLLAAVGQWTAPVPIPAAGSELRLPALLNEATLAELESDTSPEVMPELVSMLLEESEGYVRDIADAARLRDCMRGARAAHALKSNAGAIGADRLRHLALAIELAGRGGDDARLGELQRQLAQVAPATRQAYQQHFSWDPNAAPAP